MQNSNFSKVLIIIGAAIVYYLLLKPLGFILSSVLIAALCMYMMGCRKYIAMAIYTVVMPSIIFCIFYYLLQVSLPLGILAGIIPEF